MQASGEKQIGGTKYRDRSIALLIVGIVLLFPPFVGLSLIDARVFGIPFPVFYIFFVWAALIAGAVYLAGPLRDSDVSGSSAESAKPDF